MVVRDQTRPKPIPPLSVVRLAHVDDRTPDWRMQIGRVFRIGYYSPQDGLDCVWLVNDQGEYEQTTDHDYLYKFFDIVSLSDENEFYGENRAQIGPR